MQMHFWGRPLFPLYFMQQIILYRPYRESPHPSNGGQRGKGKVKKSNVC